MKRMLFNATQAEELRVAIVDGQKIIDLDIELASKEQRKSNIYKGVITRIEPSLEAAFVNYGAERHGFLPFKEISRSYFKEGVDASRATIKEALREGQEIIVQVEKEERGNKGAALTTYVSLAGRYLVLMPNNPRGGGVSRRVEGDERTELREVMDSLDVPAGMSLIARTAAIGRSAEELQWDMNYLLQLWTAIDDAATPDFDAESKKRQNPAPFLIYQESSLVIRAIRDYFQPDIGEILIDTDDIFEQATQFMAHVMPSAVNRVKRYHDDVPLFSRFQIEHQIESAYGRQVNLPSGGAVVIDHTEALVAIDVNSGRATKGSDIEETALRTNLEAADEVARQLRLRDLGGLIVIDFIDMENQRNQREVENRLRDALRYDRARVQTGKISRFGLLELSRQRLRPALAETSYIPCPRCTGTGHIRSTESAALHILRILEEEAMKENTGALHCQVPVDVATFLLNEKRDDIAKIELRHKVSLLIIPNRHLETPQQEIVRLRHDQLNQDDSNLPSYKRAAAPADAADAGVAAQKESRPVRQEAAVKGITPEQPAPTVAPTAKPSETRGFFRRILDWLAGDSEAAPKAAAPAPRGRNERRGERRRDDNRNGGRSKDRTEANGERKNKQRAEESQERNRQERGDRAERPDRNRNERKEQAKPEARTDKPETQKAEPRQPRERRERSPRQAREAQVSEQQTAELAVVAAASVAAEALTVDASETTGTPEAREGREGRNRRGRRGRGRGERRQDGEAQVLDGEQTEQLNDAEPSSQQAPLAEVASAAVAVAETFIRVEAPEVTQVAGETSAAPAVLETQESISTNSIQAVAVVEAPESPAIIATEQAAPLSVVAETPAMAVETPVSAVQLEESTQPAEVVVEPIATIVPEVGAPAIVETLPESGPVTTTVTAAAPQVDLQTLLAAEAESLQMVETSAVARSAEPPQAAEAVTPTPRRERVTSAEEPLQQVETRN
ncbi:MAG: ribonuclease E/G [Candidatus Dactylopiibacterium carminicum]|uniref:Ribonuclease E n=1 Tax=Candidatus Dactylopiibacterium carminicum TaxID=857335 RepID=A0A272ESN4_9RHOO|nr:Rne/Rng family ribonuclease [Candidatus Dactylopiibacterium carminicum]KAF7599108.1 ribonuclease E/G [Candidatus Dactylopiibacterium carminicum]PAS93131.1 MAG: ribonuclease E/G [Candidatus Dactylopiibacterium carminicum]PAS99121.1 MAG: ribonuclease E/G [Candidatus Dactylopiibacterium carminicum]